jgi:glyoxylase-like metal-dependent hydrolase (beta-lactamase superfamily II)
VELEDHVGDIVRKGRLQAGVSLPAAAQAAGLAPAELTALENSGIPPRKPDYAALAALLTLHARKLEDIANGWRPAPADLRRWRELRQITTFGQAYAANCHLVWDKVTKEAALFDTGFDPAAVCALVEANRLKLKRLFITHNHSDHAAGLPAIAKRFPTARWRHHAEPSRAEQGNQPGDFIPLGGLRISLRATPGHTDDGITFVVTGWPATATSETAPPPVAIVGDALFAGSMGNVCGDAAQARQVIREQILSLPPDTLLCPGHGPLTTVAEELAHNPFF